MQTVSMAGTGDQPLYPMSKRCRLGNLVVELILMLVAGCGLVVGHS
jgi:hypothetical protein